jgi:hypothetical protein
LVPHDVRDQISERTELTAKRLLGWMQLGTSKFHQWKDRYGKANEHNGKVPRDWWLEEWEKAAIVTYHGRHPLNGYRRLAFMMLDDDVVAVAPTSVYRVLNQAGRLDRHRFSPSKKGTGFVQPRPWNNSQGLFQLAVAFIVDDFLQTVELVGRRDVFQRTVQPHLVILLDEGGNPSPRLLDIRGTRGANALPLQAAVPALQLAVALRIEGARADVRHAHQPNVFLEVAGDKLRTVVADDPRRLARERRQQARRAVRQVA